MYVRDLIREMYLNSQQIQNASGDLGFHLFYDYQSLLMGLSPDNLRLHTLMVRLVFQVKKLDQ